ncbi:MAG: M20/M25/M40 family metallo-hydrolase, partial [Acidobacteriota bacterium]
RHSYLELGGTVPFEEREDMPKLARRSMAAILIVVLLCSSATPQFPGARPVPSRWRQGFRTINAEDAREWLGVLAGPDFRGRSPRTSDYAAAAGYTSALLRRWGLKPLGDEGSFFQRFQTETVAVVPESASLATEDAALRLDFMKDFALRAYDEFESMERISFLRAPQGTDLSKLDLAAQVGNFVVVAAEMPAENRAAYRALVDGWSPRVRVIVPVARPELLRSSPVTRVKGIPPAASEKFAGLSLTATAARKVAEYCGATAFLAPAANTATLEICPHTFALRSKVAVKDDISSFNVVAKIEGSDPLLRSECVFIGAHLDHLGARERGIHWGADDNASGVTAALLIARAITQNPVKPKRSVVIGLWAMEESGLLGSWAYVNRPSFPLSETVAYLNMDQVGRDEEDPRFNEKAEANATSIYIGSVKFNSEDLYRVLRATNGYINLRLKPDREDRTLRSDTASFYRKGIPTLKAFTGEHPDYHREGDTPNKVNYAKLVNIAKWLYLTSMELGTQPGRPRFQKRPFELWTIEDVPTRSAP